MIEEKIELTESEVGEYRLIAKNCEPYRTRATLDLLLYEKGIATEQKTISGLKRLLGLKPVEKVQEQREKWGYKHSSLLSPTQYLDKPLEEVADQYRQRVAQERSIVLPFQTVQQLLESCLEPYIQRARRIEEALKIR